jgi:hypothetical protein
MEGRETQQLDRNPKSIVMMLRIRSSEGSSLRASGSRLSLTSTTGGSSTSYPISVSTTWDSANGNRWNQNGGGSATQLTINGKNQIDPSSGYLYDAAGNVIDDGFFHYRYDAEGRMLEVRERGSDAVLASYLYSPQGLRVKVTKGAEVREYVYDLAGREVAEISGRNVTRTEIHLGGAHLAVETGSTMYYLHTDWLGTVRQVSSAASVNEGRCTSLPYGDGLDCTGAVPLRHRFTDYVRDSESSLEHSWFRQYSSGSDAITRPTRFWVPPMIRRRGIGMPMSKIVQ